MSGGRLKTMEGREGGVKCESGVVVAGGLTFGGFLIGLVRSIVFGLYAGWLFPVIYNGLSRRWAAGK